MPLRKLKGVPKIPKTRKKKAHSALSAVPLKKPDNMEYNCSVYFKWDEKTKKQYYAFAIETVVEFTSFAYEVSVDVIREKNVFYFVITGLKAKTNVVPQIAPAKAELLFEELIGDITVNVVKQDGAINAADYNFNIYKKEIELLKEYKPRKKNNRLFCKFYVAENLFSFSPVK